MELATSSTTANRARAGRVTATHRPGLIEALGLVVVDFVAISVASFVAIVGRMSLPWFDSTADLNENVAGLGGILLVLWLGALAISAAYNWRQLGAGTAEYRAVLRGSLLAAALVGITSYLLQYPLSRGYFVLVFGVGIPALILFRTIVRRILKGLRRRGVLTTQVLVAGAVAHVDDLTTILRRESWLGYQVIGALPSDSSAPLTPKGLVSYGNPERASEALVETGATGIIFAEGSFQRAHMFNTMARTLEHQHAQMMVVPALTDVSAERLAVRPVAGIPLVHIERTRAQNAGRWAKRSFDIVGAALTLVLVSPVMLAVAIAVRSHDGGPALFRQIRVGRDGQLFPCLKFRSMTLDAADARHDRSVTNHADGPLFKDRRDPRITPAGRILRRYSLDELPQLLNVLRGDMSLVGPRPALPTEVDNYEEHVRRRLDVRPGMTGLWQVSGRSDLSWEETVRLDLYYVDNWSFLQDVQILNRTVGAVIRGRGAY